MRSSSFQLSLVKTVLRIKNKASSSRGVVEASIAAYRRTNAETNAVTEYNTELALQQADAFDATEEVSDEAVLGGVPISFKDNFSLLGYNCTAGSRMLGNMASTYDASVVTRIRRAGGIPCAKTNMDEFGMGSCSSTGMHGPVYSPLSVLSPEGGGKKEPLTAGGSSGGAAAAVAAGVVCAAVGSDTGGSVRQPASFCGLVGFKPTYGALSRHGLISYASSMDCPGVLTTNVADAGLLVDVLSGPCANDSTSLRAPYSGLRTFHQLIAHVQGSAVGRLGGPPSDERVTVRDLETWERAAAGGALGSLSGLKVGVPAEGFLEEADDEVREACIAAAAVLRDAGADMYHVSMPVLKLALPCYYVLACAEASSNLMRYDGLRYGYSHDGTDEQISMMGDTHDHSDMTALHRHIARARGAALGPQVVQRLLTGTYVLSEGARGDFFEIASHVRASLMADMRATFESVDVLLTPTVTKLPFLAGVPLGAADMLAYDVLTVSANLAGLPALSVPSGISQDGRPIGMQIMGPKLGDAMVLEVGLALEGRL